MPAKNRYEQQFLDALEALFVGARVEGASGYVNLMRIKSRYYTEAVFPQLMRDVDAACRPFDPGFREELFDKLYDFFARYFSESGSLYFRHTAPHHAVYERVYTDDRDVLLFWKTSMLYYVKTDRLYTSMDVAVEGERFFFDVSRMELKRANEKRALLYDFVRREPDGRLVFAVNYTERGRVTKMEDIARAIKATGIVVDEATLERAFRVFEQQAEVDYFINKDARAFLREQFDLWLYHYLFRGHSDFAATRLAQLQTLQTVAYAIIDYIAQFEDELVKVWNKPKFVLNSHYVITLDRLFRAESPQSTVQSRTSEVEGLATEAETAKIENLKSKILSHPGMAAQMDEWRALGMLSSDLVSLEDLTGLLFAQDLLGAPLYPQTRYLPLDTKHFPDLEPDILALFDDLDQALDGWLVHSENYQALNTLLPKFKGRVKAIYIDPPYNTKGSEIAYVNDYKHSSWLTLMENRLQTAKILLQDDGILCVAIDDSEYHRLQNLLCDIFPDKDAILGTAAIRSNPAGRSTVIGMSVAHDYAIFVAKGELASLGRLVRTEKQIGRYKEHDEKTAFEWVNFRKHGGAAATRAARPRMFYPIYATEKGEIRIPEIEWNAAKQEWTILEQPKEDEVVILPIGDKGEEKRWKWGHTSVIDNVSDFCVKPDQNGRPAVYMKSRMKYEGLLPLTWWEKKEYSATDHGTNLLNQLFGYIPQFTFPKSIYTVEDCLRVTNLEDDEVCLDFFAGSGTTAHAVMNLNRADGGRRKYILVEMGTHFYDVILPRIKKVAFCEKWKDGVPLQSLTAQGAAGSGMSQFVKYYDLEQYEDTLRRARYEDHAAPLFAGSLDALTEYVFLRDLKLLDAVTVHVEPPRSVAVDLAKLYPGIDLAETLSCLTGKWIKRVTADAVEFEDGSTASLSDPAWELVKPLVWW